MILFDGLGNVVQLNHKACKILGVKSEDQFGKPLAEGQLRSSVDMVIKTGTAIPYDLQECRGKKYVCSLVNKSWFFYHIIMRFIKEIIATNSI